MDGLGPIDIEILINNPALLRSLLQGERDFQGVNNRITQQAQATSAQLNGWAKSAATLAASYFSIAAAKNFIAELVNVRGEFEQLQVAYETILKSKAKGDQLFGETAQFAATTPFNFSEVAKGTKQLLAYGFTAGEIISTLTTLGNVASGVSAPLGDIVYLYGTLKTQGRAYAQDIRQFTSRGIPIIAELAKQFGVNEDQVNKLVEAGRIGFPEVEKAFQSLTGSSGIFYNLMEKQSHTLTGQLSNLQDAFQMMLNNLGQSSEGILTGGIQAAADLVKNYQKVLDIIEILLITYGAYRASLLVTVAVQAIVASGATTMAAAELLQYGALVLVEKAQTAYNSAAASGALATAAYTAVIASLVIAIKAWHDASELQNDILAETNQIGSEAAVKVDIQKVKIKDLTDIINDHNSTQEQRLGALKKLNEISPEYLGNITLETAGTKAASQAIKAYLADLDKKLVGEAAYSQKLENLKKISELKTKGIDAIGSFERVGFSLKRFFSTNNTASTLFSGDADDKATVDQLVSMYEQANKQIDKQFGAQIKDNLTGGTAAAAIANKFQDDLKKALSAKGVKPILDAYSNLVKEAANATDLEALRDALTAKLKSLAPDDKQKEDLKKRLAEVKKILDSYSLTADAKAETSAFDAAQRYGDLLQKIYQLNEKYNASTLTDNEQKLQAIRNEYDKLRVDIDKYNANPKNTRKINKDTLQANENSAINNQTESNETKDIAEAIDQQKALYDEYYSYRDKLGEAAANKEYADLLAGGQDFESYLQTIENMFLSSDLTPQAYEDRQKLLTKYGIAAKKETSQKNTDLLASSLGYYQQLQVMDDTYQRTRTDFVAKGNTSAVEELDKNHKAEVESLQAGQADKLAVLQHYTDNVVLMTKQQAKAQLQALRDAQGNSNLSGGENASIDAAAKNLQEALSNSGGLSKKYTDDLKQQKVLLLDQLKTQTVGSAKWTEIFNKIAQVNALLDQQATKAFTVSNDLSSVSQDFSMLAEAVGGVNTELGQTLTALSQVAKVGSDAFNSFASFSSGDIFGGIGSAISAITGVFSLFSNAKQNAEQMAYSADLQQKAMDAVNKSLERQLALVNQIYGPERLTAYTKQLNDIAAAQTDLQNKLSGRLSLTGNKVVDEQIAKLNNGEKINELVYGGLIKAFQDAGKAADLTGKSLEELNVLLDQGKLDANTAAIVQNMIALKDQALDTLNALKAEVTGTSFDEITDSILNLFASGTTAVDDFAKNFEATMNKAILNSFKRDVLDKELQGFFDAFYADSKDGLDKNDIDALKKIYDAAIAEAQKKFDALQQATGMDLTNPNSTAADNTLSGAIKGITSDEAGILAGTTRGIQVAMNQVLELSKISNKSVVDSNAELRAQTIIQKQIAANTLRIADNTDEVVPTLKRIEDKMAKNSNDLAANGR